MEKKIIVQEKEFNSYKEAYEFYGIDKNTFYKRKNLGWPLDKCLTTKVGEGARGREGKLVEDHEGHKFRSITEMCKHWEISQSTFNSRLNAGWSLEESLVGKGYRIKDHKGHAFKSLNELCKAWGIAKSTYYKKSEKGCSLKEILEIHGTEQIKEKKAVRLEVITDHKGNIFKTVGEMCKAWKVNRENYYLKKRKGWRLEDILEPQKETIEDGLGNKFNGLREMGEYYKIKAATIRNRLNVGKWTLPAAIIIPVGKGESRKARKVLTNIDGNTWYKVPDMGRSLYDTKDIVEFYRPDLLEAYLKTSKSERE